MSFAVVSYTKFPEESETIPVKWFSSDPEANPLLSRFPDFRLRSAVDNAVRMQIQPDDRWPIFETKVLGLFETLAEAKRKEQASYDTSNLETDDEGQQLNRRRRRIPNSKYPAMSPTPDSPKKMKGKRSAVKSTVRRPSPVKSRRTEASPGTSHTTEPDTDMIMHSSAPDDRSRVTDDVNTNASTSFASAINIPTPHFSSPPASDRSSIYRSPAPSPQHLHSPAPQYLRSPAPSPQFHRIRMPGPSLSQKDPLLGTSNLSDRALLLQLLKATSEIEATQAKILNEQKAQRTLLSQLGAGSLEAPATENEVAVEAFNLPHSSFEDVARLEAELAQSSSKRKQLSKQMSSWACSEVKDTTKAILLSIFGKALPQEMNFYGRGEKGKKGLSICFPTITNIMSGFHIPRAEDKLC
eukprot:GHVO01051454.1.p1 GENE.GHVO01051454.1~~GHVO01051454.1.p1  ORF type:complete len:411 (+),score=36.89 GHVO01051454.1:987-2219(+)